MKHSSTCSLCEACCACTLDIEGDQILSVEPDTQDPYSESFICPKGRAIPEIESHSRRLHSPLVRRDDSLQPASWEQAFSRVEEILAPIIKEHGPKAIGIYIGNGAAHNSELSQYLRFIAAASGSPNFFTSGTLDQVPRQVVSGLMYGSIESVPVPDIDRCDLLCIIGANPAESNGSLWTVPGVIKRFARLKARGGEIVVVDPQTSRTAKLANLHLAVNPGTDAWLLAAVARLLLEKANWRDTPLPLDLPSLETIKELLRPFSSHRASEICGVDQAGIESLAERLAGTPRAAVYGRMGTTTQQFASLTVWLIDLVNILAGNLDREGGVMFAKPLAAQNNSYAKPSSCEDFSIGKWRSRVSGFPEVMGELPVRALPEEIETEGPGQIRALVCITANPLISNMNAARVKRSFAALEGLICLDIHANETGQLADVILPSPPRLARCNYDRFFYQFTARNYARYTQAYRPLKAEERSDREIALRLTAILSGKPWSSDIDALDAALLAQRVDQEIHRPGSTIASVGKDAICSALNQLPPKERLLDLDIRTGPYGDAFGNKEGYSLESLKQSPHGLDLGPLKPRLPDLLRTRSGKINLLPDFVAEALNDLAGLQPPSEGEFRMVGRRQLGGNNSWMHHIPALQNNRTRCDLLVSLKDALRIGIETGDAVKVSRNGAVIKATARVTEDIKPGVLSLPHGWGHESLAQGKASDFPDIGVNVNELTLDEDADSLTNTACLNGYSVALTTDH